MRISLKQLENLKVETVLGKRLGKIFDIVFEIDGQLITQYSVKPSAWSTKVYLISRDQVVHFEKDKLVVDDSVVREKILAVAESKVTTSPTPAVMRGED